MKKALVFVFILCFVGLHAQEKFKFGDAPMDDIKMTVYNADTSASAVLLHNSCELSYTTDQQSFVIVTSYIIRYKILKNSSLDLANIVLSEYNGEDVSKISGNVFNLEDGKVVKIQLKKGDIIEEKVSDYTKEKKIIFPNVKIGSVFELRYQKTTPYIRTVPTFYFQKSVPVRYAYYKVTIPEYFKFSKNVLGYETVNYSTKNENITLGIAGQLLRTVGKTEIYTATNLPALKQDDFVWDINDYASKVSYEMAGIQIPGAVYESYAYSWANIDKQLNESESFGKKLNVSGILKDEVKAIASSEGDDLNKISSLLQLVKDKVKWNDKNYLYIDRPRAVLKEGIGSSADINAILISVLKDAGYDAYPVVMSLRSRGRIHMIHPSLNSLNYFVVGVDLDEKSYYMDGSTKYGTINTIHSECMVENARSIKNNKSSKWVDLHNMGNNSDLTAIFASMDEEGIITGNLQRILKGVVSMNTCSSYYNAKNEEEYISKIEEKLNIKITNFTITDCDKNNTTISYSFELNDPVDMGDIAYIYPIIFSDMRENSFTSENRRLPVEFSYPTEQQFSLSLAIPENYKAEAALNPMRIKYDDENSVSYLYTSEATNSGIKVAQKLSIKRTLYPAEEYPSLRDFWSIMNDKKNEQFVLKKTSN